MFPLRFAPTSLLLLEPCDQSEAGFTPRASDVASSCRSVKSTSVASLHKSMCLASSSLSMCIVLLQVPGHCVFLQVNGFCVFLQVPGYCALPASQWAQVTTLHWMEQLRLVLHRCVVRCVLERGHATSRDTAHDASCVLWAWTTIDQTWLKAGNCLLKKTLRQMRPQQGEGGNSWSLVVAVLWLHQLVWNRMRWY